MKCFIGFPALFESLFSSFSDSHADMKYLLQQFNYLEDIIFFVRIQF